MRPRIPGPQIRIRESGPSGLAFSGAAGASSWRTHPIPSLELVVPPFNHLHPAIVHFPLGLLVMVPALFLLGALWPVQRRGIHAVALGLLVLGVLGVLAALATGEAAESMARRTPELRTALEHHQASAQWTAALFGILTVAWLVHLGLSRFLHRDLPSNAVRALFVLWLLGSVAGVAALLRTGHLGGRLVHELHTHGDER